MTRMFGTDGVRGVANRELTPELAYAIGVAASIALTDQTAHKPTFAVGSDTRVSCGMLTAALVAGLTSAGADVIDAGVIATPGVAWLTRDLHADAGVMISASHNTFEYNGIKIFSGRGFKLPDDVEDAIEALIRDGTVQDRVRPKGDRVGRVSRYPEGADRYREHLHNMAGVDLSGMRIVVDCANGASYRTAPRLFRDLGADVDLVGAEPNGYNINDRCGSTHVESLCRRVLETGADIGLAFDGDADRLIVVDDRGDVVDGDVMLAILAKALDRRGQLRHKTIVATVMSNLGLERMTEANGYTLVRAAVGDRYVLERMLADDYVIGGEQSGHIILLDDTTTGDGQLTALRLLGAFGRDERLSDVRRIMRALPQVLVNVHVPNALKKAVMDHATLAEARTATEAKLGNRGRVLIRPSGTEPSIRVMLEGDQYDEIEAYAEDLRHTIETLLANDLGE